MKSIKVLVTVDSETTIEEITELLKDYFNGEREYETIKHRYIAPNVEDVSELSKE